MKRIGLRSELGALRDAINELRAAIQKYSETTHAANEARNEDKGLNKSLPVTVSYVQEVSKEQKDSYATQEGIRKWTKGAVIAASIYAAIAAITFVVLYCQLKVTMEGQRPFLSLSGTPEISALSFDNGVASANIAVTVKNAGPVPAKAVVYLVHFQATRPVSFKDISDVCDYGKLGARSDDVNGGEFIIPHDERPFTLHVESDTSLGGGKVPIFLVGCIGYDDPVPWKSGTLPDYRFSFVAQFVMLDGNTSINTAGPSVLGCFENDHWGDNNRKKENEEWTVPPVTAPEKTYPCPKAPTKPN